jgi:hypothetical protein
MFGLFFSLWASKNVSRFKACSDSGTWSGPPWLPLSFCKQTAVVQILGPQIQRSKMPRTISGRCLRPRTFLFQLLKWFYAKQERRKWSSQRSLWGGSCTWAIGVPIELLQNSAEECGRTRSRWALLVELRWVSEGRLLGVFLAKVCPGHDSACD